MARSQTFVRLAAAVTALVATASLADWTFTGGDAGHSKFAPADQVNRENVHGLVKRWQFSTGDRVNNPDASARWKFQVTPVLFEGHLVFCSPRNEVIALDPATGEARWRFDPAIDLDNYPSHKLNCRGVTPWTDDSADSTQCKHRIFTTTVDRRLIALDATSGKRCTDFGTKGEVTIQFDKERRADAVTLVSAPAVARDTVLVGSAIDDGNRTDEVSGTVRAFDARTGELRWTWDPIPRSPEDPRWDSWLNDSATRTGAANAWAPISADEKRGVFYLPTGSASTDYYGGERPGLNRDANSVVALSAETGERLWAFQTVRHDIWDYDVSAPPTLVTRETASGEQDVVVQVTKMGFVFVLDRETGEPVFGISEREVDESDVEGEWQTPSQPVPIKPPPLVPESVEPWGLTPIDRGACEDTLSALRYEGLFTPPSLQGTVVHPFSGGGANWGGVSFHPKRQVLIVNTSDAAEYIRLFPREAGDADIRNERMDQAGTPYIMDRGLIMSPFGAPCNEPPWGRLHAVDLGEGELLWSVPLGTFEDVAPLGDLILPDGTPNLGGPLTTGGGLVFIGATMDDYLRAFDIEDGRELWKGRLPAGGQASPMSYEWKGTQYVVIGAGGHGLMGTTPGDYIVAFALDPAGDGPGAMAILERPTPRLLAIVAAVLSLLILWRIWRRRPAQ